MHVVAYAPYGAEGILIRVEADIRRGIPGVDVTGLADGAVREARERVRAACRNSGFPFPADRVLVNLAPAGVRKEGAGLDLAIALAILSAAGLVPDASGLMVMGELELSGTVRPVRGVLAATAAGLAAGVEGFIVPRGNAAEAGILASGRAAAVADLSAAAAALAERSATGRLPALPPPAAAPGADDAPAAGDFAAARGLERYKRALEIAAAGGHNLLAFGPPGSGKTLLARRFPSIQAALTPEESVAATRLHSLAGLMGEGGRLVARPPFRSPHHSASAEGLLGGGRTVRPGEISLAHYGALFLDEAPEFRSDALRALREPLEDAVVTIARAEGSVRLPADFQLILAANPCPCGRLGLAAGSCLCPAEAVARHWRRLGAALLDRVELRVPVWPDPLVGEERPESSSRIAARVAAAVERQRRRYGPGGPRRNGRLDAAGVERWCRLAPGAERVYRRAAAKLALSHRAAHAVLRVARTIADLAASDAIEADHLLEAVQHRRYGEDPYDIAAARVRSEAGEAD
jgi:magnesium chelatase family protein